MYDLKIQLNGIQKNIIKYNYNNNLLKKELNKKL